MALAKIYSIALLGVAGHVVEVEADIADGVPAFNLLGLPDAALSESRDRVRSALTLGKGGRISAPRLLSRRPRFPNEEVVSISQ